MTYVFVISMLIGSVGWAWNAQAQEFGVVIDDPAWDGETVPRGQECEKDGGNGLTPLMTVHGIPDDANVILVEFNDESYEPLSTDGGHGIVGYDINVGDDSAILLMVPGNLATLPNGVWIEQENRGNGNVAGYLPPCSGGKGHLYSAKVFAVDYGEDGYKVLAETYLQLGRY
jgi:hypothetical protein